MSYLVELALVLIWLQDTRLEVAMEPSRTREIPRGYRVGNQLVMAHWNPSQLALGRLTYGWIVITELSRNYNISLT